MSEDDLDDSEWQSVPFSNNRTTLKRTLNYSPKVIPRKVPNNNTFSILTNNNDEIEVTNEEDNNNPTLVEEERCEVKPKIPTIIIPGVNDISSMIKKFSDVIPINSFHFKSLNDGQIRVMNYTIESYRKLVQYLKTKKILFHTYQMKEDRAYRLVLKNLHYFTPIELIKCEIESYDHKVRNITNIRCRITKNRLSKFFLDLEPGKKNKDIYLIRHIGNALITIEPPHKRNEIVQCQRCQQFGHTKSYCYKPSYCVRHNNQTTPPNHNRIDNARFSSHTNFSHNNNENSYASILKGSENQRENNNMKSIEDLLRKQIDLRNTLFSRMTVLMNKLCSQN